MAPTDSESPGKAKDMVAAIGKAVAAGFSDVLVFILKNLLGGLLIFAICCYQGLQVQRSPHEIPQVTTKAVVKSTVYVLVFNMILTLYFYFEYIANFGLL